MVQSAQGFTREDFVTSLEQLAALSVKPEFRLKSGQALITAGVAFEAALQPGHKYAFQQHSEQLLSCTNAYNQLARHAHSSGSFPSGTPEVDVVLQPLFSLCQMAGRDKALANIFCISIETLVDVASNQKNKISPESISSLLDAAEVCLPSAHLDFSNMEAAAASAAAMSSLCTTFATSLSAAQAQQVFAQASKSLHALATSNPPADDWHAKVLLQIVTALSSLAPEKSINLRDSIALLVDALTLLWTFGIQSSAAKPVPVQRVAQPAAPGSPSQAKYVPPWRRSSQRSSSDAADTSPYSSDASTSSRRDTDTGLRVRVATLKLLNLLLQHHPTTLHPVWDRLLPHSNATLPSARPRSLLGVLLHDSSATARTSAAVAVQAMLTGPRNAAFIRVARSADAGQQRRSRLAPARAFMPLSESLALMVQAMHTCLSAVLQREAVHEVILEALKAADLLMQQAPYQNLPPSLPQDLVNACASSWNSSDTRTDAQGSHSGSLASPRSPRQDGVPKRCAVLALIASAVSSSAKIDLTNLAMINPADRGAWHRQGLIPVLMLCAAPGAVHPALQWEACAVLRALCQHRAEELPLRWEDVQALVTAHVNRVAEATAAPQTPGRRGARPPAPSASMPEKVANQAVRLAGDFACASCQLAGAPGLPAQNEGLLSLAEDFTATMATCVERSTAPAVRSAAYAALATAPAELWAALPGDRLEREVCAMQRIVDSDAVPAVRAHAVAAVAGAVSHPRAFTHARDAWVAAASALLQAAGDGAASVRVAGAVALARVCVQLRLLVHPADGDGGDDAEPGALPMPPRAPGAGAAEATEGQPCVPVDAVLTPEAWAALRDAALASASGGDKTSAHGLRALGCLCALLPVQESPVSDSAVLAAMLADQGPDGPARSGDDEAWSAWLADAIRTIKQGLVAAGPKGAWNSCIAAAQLFLQRERLGGMIAPAALEDLHAAVLTALQRTQNFKVRIHAARALHAAGAAVCLGGVSATLLAVVDALRSVEAEGAAGGGSRAASELGAARPDPEAHFKYHGELLESLTGVLVELLAACAGEDLGAAAGDLPWILEFLDSQVAAWSVLPVPQPATDEGELAGQEYMTQEATLRGDVEEVAVRGAQLQLAIPPACGSIAAAVQNVNSMSRQGHITLAPEAMDVVSRLQALLGGT